jgi:hypothetical protein
MAAGTSPRTPSTQSPRDLAVELLASLARAKAERLVAYPSGDGTWSCRDYQIVETGPRPQDVRCDCADAVFRERLCKHSAVVVFARKYGLRPIRPQLQPEPAYEPAEKALTRSCRKCQINPVHAPFLYCPTCASPANAASTAELAQAHGAGYFRPVR